MNTILNAIALFVFGAPVPAGFIATFGPYIYRAITRTGERVE